MALIKSYGLFDIELKMRGGVMKLKMAICALIGIKDVETFWEAREVILSRNSKHMLAELLCKIIRRHYGAAIPINKEINHFNTPHGFYGIFISKNAKIDEGCLIYQQVTIGSDDSGGAPIIGKNCLIGAGAKVIGNVRVGNNVRIGANAIVVTDIPDDCTVVMNKPRIILHKDNFT